MVRGFFIFYMSEHFINRTQLSHHPPLSFSGSFGRLMVFQSFSSRPGRMDRTPIRVLWDTGEIESAVRAEDLGTVQLLFTGRTIKGHQRRWSSNQIDGKSEQAGQKSDDHPDRNVFYAALSCIDIDP